MGLNPIDELKERARDLFNRIRSRDDVLTVARGTRILRFGAGEVWGIDPSAQDAQLEDTIAWMDRVIENIEQVLDVIDRKRVLWWTAIAAGFAAVAAIFAAISIGLQVFGFLPGTGGC